MKYIFFSFFFLIFNTYVFSQETISTGLEDPCEQEVEKWFAPGTAVLNLEKLPVPLPKASLIKYLPAIGNQGQQGSCTAFSVAAALTILQNQRNNDTFNVERLSDLDLLCSPAFIFNIGKSFYPLPRKTNCMDGISYIDAFHVVQEFGIVYMPDFRYNLSGTAGCESIYYPSDKVKKKASKKKIFTFQKPDLDLEIFKYLLSNKPGYPINIAVTIDKNYRAASNKQNNCSWLTKGAPIPGQPNNKHAMLIVGYDDIKQCFRVLDSRGKNSGDNGFLWLSYDLLKSRVIYDAYVCSFDDELLKEAKAQNTGEGDIEVIPNSTASTWLKEGYFRIFNGIKIVCLEIDKSEEKFVFALKDKYTNQKLIQPEFTIFLRQESSYTVNGKTFSIFLKEFGFEGKNPFKAAARFDITMVNEKIEEENEITKVNNENNNLRNSIEKCLDISDQMIYAGPSSLIPLGAILSEDRDFVVSNGFLEGNSSRISTIVSLGTMVCAPSGNSLYENTLFRELSDSLKNIFLNAKKIDLEFNLVIEELSLSDLQILIKNNDLIDEFKMYSEKKYNIVSKVIKIESVVAKIYLDQELTINKFKVPEHIAGYDLKLLNNKTFTLTTTINSNIFFRVTKL